MSLEEQVKEIVARELLTVASKDVIELAKNALKNRTVKTVRVSELGELMHVFDLVKYMAPKLGVDYNKVYKEYGPTSLLVQSLSKSIREVGVVHPIVVSQDGVIIDGMMRYIALLHAPPETQVPLEVLDIKCKSKEDNLKACLLLAYLTTLVKGRAILTTLDGLIKQVAPSYAYVQTDVKLMRTSKTSLLTWDQMIEMAEKSLGIPRDEIDQEYRTVLSRWIAYQKQQNKKHIKIDHTRLLAITLTLILMRQCRDSRRLRQQIWRITGVKVTNKMMLNVISAVGRVEPNCVETGKKILEMIKVGVPVDEQLLAKAKTPYDLASILRHCYKISGRLLAEYLGTGGARKMEIKCSP